MWLPHQSTTYWIALNETHCSLPAGAAISQTYTIVYRPHIVAYSVYFSSELLCKLIWKHGHYFPATIRADNFLANIALQLRWHSYPVHSCNLWCNKFLGRNYLACTYLHTVAYYSRAIQRTVETKLVYSLLKIYRNNRNVTSRLVVYSYTQMVRLQNT